MSRRSLAVAALATLLSAAACAPPAPPPNVPGPTTARAEDLRPDAAPPVATTPVRVALKSPDARVVAIRIAFAAGSADDPAGKEGLTRLTAKTMAEGGTQALSYADLSSKPSA